MFTPRIRLAGKCLAGALLALLVIGCSEELPLTAPISSGQPLLTASPDGQVQFVAVVATADAATRTLTFDGADYVVIADDDCQIVRITAGDETVVEFADIVAGDSVKVCGLTQEDGTILAHRIRIYCTCDADCINYDLKFRDQIVTIDYAGGSFTVAGMTETILVDGNTVIWTTIGGGMAAGETDYTGDQGGTVSREAGARRVDLAFTDLAEGYTVQVKAIIEDAATLRAVEIKVAGESYEECNLFEAALATVDLNTRTVTFDGLNWIGVVCQNALLSDADGAVLVLEDFAAGDLVSVKGFPLEGDTLKVCALTKL